MTGRSDFTDQEWAILTDAPMQVVITMYAAGAHGPISTIKELKAGAKLLREPGNRGEATGLINEISEAAQNKDSSDQSSGSSADSVDDIIQNSINDLKPASETLSKIPASEAQAVGEWFMDIAVAVAKAAKGVTDTERATVAKLAAVFNVAAPSL